MDESYRPDRDAPTSEPASADEVTDLGAPGLLPATAPDLEMDLHGTGLDGAVAPAVAPAEIPPAEGGKHDVEEGSEDPEAAQAAVVDEAGGTPSGDLAGQPQELTEPASTEIPAEEAAPDEPAPTEATADESNTAEAPSEAEGAADAGPSTATSDGDAAAEPEPSPPTQPPVAATEPSAATEPAPDTQPPVAATEPSAATEPAPDTQPPVAEAQPAAPATVAEHLAASMRSLGVRWAFTVPGESFLGLLEALDGAGIRTVATRHEGAAGFMAEAVGQLTGRPAAALVTRAVGASNLAIAVHTARQDSAPFVGIVGQVQRAHLGREAFQEADIAGSIGQLAKAAVEPLDAAAAPRAIDDTLRRAVTGRPGPVILSLPEDLLDEPLAPSSVPIGRPGRAPAPRPDPEVVRAVIQLLAGARRPVILAGAGVLRARCSNDLARFAEWLHVPVIAAWRRPDVIPNDHPLYLGMTGYGSPAIVRERILAADALLVLGCRLSEVTSFGYSIPAAGQRWAHVDLEPHSGGAGSPRPDLAVVADSRAFLRGAVELLRGAVLDAENVRARMAANEADRAAWATHSLVGGSEWDGPGVHPGRIVATLRRVLPDEAILTSDAGNFAGWLARGFRFRRPGTFIGPTSGAMGYGLPAAIAAGLIHRDRPVVAWAGDGGFAMTMAELETAVRERLRLVAIVLDNQRYGMIRMHQDRRGSERPIATDLGPIDFAAVARALGADGVRLEDDGAFEAALRSALLSDRPTVIQLPLDRRWVSVDDHP